MIRPVTLLVFMMAMLLWSSCDNSADYTPAAGLWRATVTVPGGELPFHIEFLGEGDQRQAVLINGEERVPIQEMTFSPEGLALRLPAFNSTIQGKLQNDRIDGTLTLVKSGGNEQVMPFTATFADEARFAESTSKTAIDVSGRWQVSFLDASRNRTPAIGEFKQQGKKVYGTFLTETGDYRFLEGVVDDSVMHLSCFDGAHAFLFRAKLNNNNVLEGDFWSGTKWHETWTAERNDDASLSDPYALTYIKDGYDRLDFTFPDSKGKPVSLKDEMYQGKVVLVVLSGSWCPNCHDKAAFLSPFYKKYREQGLEIICLMYEHYDDFARDAVQVDRFGKKFDIDYQLLVAGSSDKVKAAKTLPMLNKVISYPTTIFLDKKGNVRKIHTGFSGPGTGEYYERHIAGFTTTVEKLLAE